MIIENYSLPNKNNNAYNKICIIVCNFFSLKNNVNSGNENKEDRNPHCKSHILRIEKRTVDIAPEGNRI
jgi:hypothetical protein